MNDLSSSHASLPFDPRSEKENHQKVAQQILQWAKQKGASQAEVSISSGVGFSVNVRHGGIETLEHHRDATIDLVVYHDNKMGSSSLKDFRPEALKKAVDMACQIAVVSGQDPCHGLADENLIAYDYPSLDLYHPWENISVDQAVETAKLCEQAGRDHSSYIVESEGASVHRFEGIALYANSHGFMGSCPSSRHSISCSLIGKHPNNPEKQTDYDYTVAIDPHDLLSADLIGKQAAQKTLARLNAKKIPTQKASVVFAPKTACSLLGHWVSAAHGRALYRGASFLCPTLDEKNKHKKILPDFMDIQENPHIFKALGSAPFDAEGVKTQASVFVKEGLLQSYVLNSYTARKLGMQTTGNAGGVHNLQWTANKPAACLDFKDLLKNMSQGLLVTSLMGQGVNILTGDYSRGATGFWVENGEIQYAVHEITIAGNLASMFLNIQALGNDVDKRGSVWSGSVWIDGMTLAGD